MGQYHRLILPRTIDEILPLAYTEFGIKEKKRPKRTALNEERLSPIFILNEDAKRILPMRKNRFVAVFPKLALSKDRILYLEVIENERDKKVHLECMLNLLKIIPTLVPYLIMSRKGSLSAERLLC